nr:ribonuclease H-like domain-containing protein [Tanacetum cinerariifolium]
MIGDRSQLTNFIHKFLGTVKFDNDQVVKILGYGDYQIGNVTILRVYYVEGLGHNLFLVGQFCDSNLEGVDLLLVSRGTNQYFLFVGDMMASSPICLLSKATKTKSLLWHRRLSHLNFGSINHLARNSLVHGLPRIKFKKDHLCSACAIGKSKKQSHKPKSEDTNQEKLYLLHIDLCGSMGVVSVNGKKYILVIVDDYSRFAWVMFLASKDEAPDFIIKFLKMIQVRLNAGVRNIHTDNGTEFSNQTLRDYHEQVGISHETMVARTPQQNGLFVTSVNFEEVRDLIRTRRVLDTVLFPPLAQVYSPPKKDMSWTGLPEFADDTITDYSRPSPSIESNSSDLQSSNFSVSEHGESSSSILSKPMIKFVKAADSPTEVKINKVEAARKSSVRYAEMYRNTSKSPKVRGNQRNWNNLKTQQLGKDFVMKNKACFKCGDFDHLAYDCGVWVNKGKSWPKNNFAQKNVTPRADLFKTASVSAVRRVNSAAPRPNVNSARPKTIQDFMIIKLIQRVKRLERELKARTPSTKIQKFDVRGRSRSVMAWVLKKV